MADILGGLSDVGPQAAGIGPLPEALIKPTLTPPTNSYFDGEWIAPTSASQIFLSSSRLRVGQMNTTYDLYGTLTSETVLNQADYYRLVVPHQTPTFDSTLPFFYRDSAREYFCVPTDYFQNGNYFTINAPARTSINPFFSAEYRFWPFYHAFVPLFVSQLNYRRHPRAVRAQPAAQSRERGRASSFRFRELLPTDEPGAPALQWQLSAGRD